MCTCVCVSECVGVLCKDEQESGDGMSESLS